MPPDRAARGREPPPEAHGPEGWRGRAPWVLGGAVLLCLALALQDHAPWAANLLIPAGAWCVLRGLT